MILRSPVERPAPPEFVHAQEAFLRATIEALEAGERHFDAPGDDDARDAYQAALVAEREAAQALAAAREALFRSRRA